MSTFWLKAGTSDIVTDAGGHPCLNAACPCSASPCSLKQKADGVVQSGTTLSNTWSAATTTNNLLVAVIGITGTAAVSSPPSGWTVAASFSTFNGAVYIYYINLAASRSGTESFGLTVSTTHGWVELMEFNSNGSPVDVVAHNSGTSTSPDSGTTASTNYPNSICVAGIWYNGSSGAFTAPTNGYTLQSNINSSGTYYGAVLTKFPTATGTQNTGVTASGSPQPWVGVIVAFMCNATTSCCTNGLPSVLHATFTNVSGCACLNGVTVAITDTGGTYTGTFITTCGFGGGATVSMSCSVSGSVCLQMTLAGTCIPGAIYNIADCHCGSTSPSWTFSNVSISGPGPVCCVGGTVNVTVTV